jgi:membrane-associated phospholipid phosphatase
MNTVHTNRKEHSKIGGLKSPNLLVQHPVFAITIILLSSMIFAILAYFVLRKGSLVKWDFDVANRMHAAALSSPAWIKNVMLSGYYIGQQGYIVVGVILGLYFLIKRFWKEFFMVIVLYAGQGILFLSLTNLIARPRPAFSENIGGVISFASFSSGHMISAVIMFGFTGLFNCAKDNITGRQGSSDSASRAFWLSLLVTVDFYRGTLYNGCFRRNRTRCRLGKPCHYFN